MCCFLDENWKTLTFCVESVTTCKQKFHHILNKVSQDLYTKNRNNFIENKSAVKKISYLFFIIFLSYLDQYFIIFSIRLVKIYIRKKQQFSTTITHFLRFGDFSRGRFLLRFWPPLMDIISYCFVNDFLNIVGPFLSEKWNIVGPFWCLFWFLGSPQFSIND